MRSSAAIWGLGLLLLAGCAGTPQASGSLAVPPVEASSGVPAGLEPAPEANLPPPPAPPLATRVTNVLDSRSTQVRGRPDCMDYRVTGTLDGAVRTVTGRSCRQADGSLTVTERNPMTGQTTTTAYPAPPRITGAPAGTGAGGGASVGTTEAYGGAGGYGPYGGGFGGGYYDGYGVPDPVFGTAAPFAFYDGFFWGYPFWGFGCCGYGWGGGWRGGWGGGWRGGYGGWHDGGGWRGGGSGGGFRGGGGGGFGGGHGGGGR